MARGKSGFSVGLVALLSGVMFVANDAGAEPTGNQEADLVAESLQAAPVPMTVKTEVGPITDLPADPLNGAGVVAVASGECHRQPVTMTYADAEGPFIKFTGMKKWCYNGQSVTYGDMDVEPWIRPDSRYGPGEDGFRYVPSALRKSDRYLAYNGRSKGAHESVRVGRFEWRVHGFPDAAQVYVPYVSRTGRYNGSCVGPDPKDLSPRVTRVRPAMGAKDVSPRTNVEATFLGSMNARTIDGSTFYLRKQGSTGPQVRATVSYNATTKTALLNPAAGLSTGTYTATVFAGPFGVLTAGGDPITSNKVWSFTVSR